MTRPAQDHTERSQQPTPHIEWTVTKLDDGSPQARIRARNQTRRSLARTNNRDRIEAKTLDTYSRRHT